MEGPKITKEGEGIEIEGKERTTIITEIENYQKEIKSRGLSPDSPEAYKLAEEFLKSSHGTLEKTLAALEKAEGAEKKVLETLTEVAEKHLEGKDDETTTIYNELYENSSFAPDKGGKIPLTTPPTPPTPPTTPPTPPTTPPTPPTTPPAPPTPPPAPPTTPPTPPSTPGKKKTKAERKAEKKAKKEAKKKEEQKTPEEKVANYLKILGLEGKLPSEFAVMTVAQRLLVLEGLVQKVIQATKEDTKKKYEERLEKGKQKTEAVEKGDGKMSKFWKKLKNTGKILNNAGKSTTARFSHEFTMKNLESKEFDNYKTSVEGKKFVRETLEQLTALNKNRNIILGKDGRPMVDFTEQFGIENPTEEEKATIVKYNGVANKWRQTSYEWGQEQASVFNRENTFKAHKKTYEKTKAQFEEAREEVLQMLVSRDKTIAGKEKAMTDLMQMSKMLELEQMVNAHPEFEKELVRMGKTAGGRQVAEWALNSLDTVTGGQGNLIYKLLFAGGFGLRQAARGAAFFGAGAGLAWITAVAAPVIGASVGYWKGKIKGKKTLAERQKEARHGKKLDTIFYEKDDDKKKVAVNIDKKMYEPLDLARRLDHYVAVLTKTPDGPQRNERLEQLVRRIEFVQGRLESGRVNFGDAKSSLANQIKLTESLNNAVMAVHGERESTNKKIEERLEQFLAFKDQEINEAQKRFIKKQAKRCAMIGAGAAAAGYAVKYVLEATGVSEHILGEKLGLLHNHTKTVGGALVTTTPEGDKIITPIGGGKPTFIEHGGGAGAVREMELTPIKHADSTYDLKSPDGVLRHFDKTGRLLSMTDPEGKNIPIPKNPVMDPNAPKEQPTKFNNTQQQTGPGKGPATQPSAPTGIQKEFTITLGKDGVPKNLETVFNEISADHLPPPADGMVNEEFATKSLNMAANLVRLTDGHGVAGISAEDFAKAVSFKGNVLEIKDHVAFNEILEKLKGHADGLWDNGTLQGNGAAITQIGKISHDNWLNIAKGEGMHEEGIVGHADVKDVTDFSHSDLVNKAGGTGYYESTLADQQIDPTAGDLASQQVDPLAPGNDLANQQVDPFAERTQTMGDATGDKGIPKMTPKEAQIPVEVDNNLPEDVVSPEQMKEVLKIQEHNIRKIFRGSDGKHAWENLKNGTVKKSAQDILTMKQGEMDAHPIYKPLVTHMKNLQKVTGLLPYEKNALRVEDESIEKYMLRALKRAVKMGKGPFEDETAIKKLKL